MVQGQRLDLIYLICMVYILVGGELRQLGVFLWVDAIVPSFVSAKCSGGRGMWVYLESL